MKAKRKKLVSIILPVYNGEKYLDISIKSCIEQTYRDWELLIIDDGSSDRSAEIAQKYEKQDSRIHFYRNEENMKLPKTLNRGFSLAKGEYLTWTSDDNYYRPMALEKMVEVLDHGDAKFVFASCSIIDENDRKISQIIVPNDFFSAIWDSNFIGACFMYTREVYELIGDYDPEVFLCEDYDYWLRIIGKFKITYLNEELYAWRKHDKSLSSQYKKGQYEMVEKVLLKNFAEKSNRTLLDKYYLYRGLHRSRSLECNFFRKYRYFPVLVCYKTWHKIFYRKGK